MSVMSTNVQQDATIQVYFICKLLYMFRVISPPIVRSTNNCIYSIWYYSTVIAICRYRGGVETQSHLLQDIER